jgi:hypothetical protein
MLLYKEFHGDLQAIANGEMMAAHEPLTGASSALSCGVMVTSNDPFACFAMRVSS